MNIREFIEARLAGDHERAYQAQGILGTPTKWWKWQDLKARFETLTRADAIHIEAHSPAKVFRQIAAARDVLERHFNDETSRYDKMACHGCPTEMYGDWTVDHIDECPELQALAWWWSDHPDWNPEWCPHLLGRHRVDVTNERAPSGAWTNACNHCGEGDGWHWDQYRPKPGDSLIPEGTDICPRCGDQNYEEATRVCITCTPGHPQHDPEDRCYLLLKARRQ